ncbi:Flp pilus assembly protein CpaB [Jeongeupia chitinilytica]|uniref:Membrane fimbriae assembly protein n=1 Tax=Jeongeupia chitinilytica TaxID=1041641 RepID=A0ABQ3GYZ7_9NEIS|nr:Flp pilus assembly protein CpaB [Jeongeupia chitinilytica]GHD62044.1 membrane fimbriae assembly protein [Jeongeupia chitinilytica]
MSTRLKRTAYGLGTAGLALMGFAMGARWSASHQPAPPPAQHYAVVQASANLIPGQPVTVEQVRTSQQPVAMPGALTTAEAAIGRLPAHSISAGAVLTEGDFSVPGFAEMLGPEERALALAVDEVKAVGNRLQPGDRVDVYVALRRDDQEVLHSEANRLLSDIRVLAFGPKAVGARNEPALPAGNDGGQNDKARSAVLAVPAGSVGDLILGQQHGQLTLVLRAPGATTDTAAVRTVAELAGSPTRALPLRTVAPPPVRQVATAERAAPVQAAQNNNESGVEVIRGKGQP